MTTRQLAETSAEIRSFLGDAIKNLVTKNDIDYLKSFIEEQSSKKYKIKDKRSTLDEKLNASEAFIDKLNDKINNIEGKLAYFELKEELKSTKIDDLEQRGHQ